MFSRSKERIEIIVQVIAKVLDKDEDTIRDCVINSEIGQAIMDKNQVVLHDQATANVYEVLMEIPESVAGKGWTIEDISSAYNSLSYATIGGDEKAIFRRCDAKGKAIIRRNRRKMKNSMIKDKRERRSMKLSEAVVNSDVKK